MKKTLVKILGIVISLILIMHNINVFALTEKEELEKEKSQINNQIEDAKKKQEELEAEKSETMKAVEELMNNISATQSEIDLLQSKITDLQAQIKSKERDIQQKETEYNEQMDLLDARLVAIYESGNTSYLDVLITSTSMTDFLAKYYAASELIECDKELIEQTKEQKTAIEAEKTELEDNKKDLDTSLAQAEQKRTSLKSMKSQKETYVAQLTEEEKKVQKEIEELQEHETSISNKIIQMQKEYDAQNSNNASSSFGFGWPVKNNTIGTKYGVAGPYWSSGYHTGVDFPVATGTQVYSVGDGQVFDTGYNSAYGYFVEIYHGNNVYSFYAHASKIQVTQGQKVSKGDPIMLSGKSGNVTGAHLHFEIRTPGYRYSDCVDPMKYLP